MFHLRVFLIFLRNSLIREMMFRGNFIIQVITRVFWFAAQIILFEIIFGRVTAIREWSRDAYFAFMATGMLINSIVEALFMPNCAELSESIRTGRLDFALTKPVDTQFLVSLQRINLAMVSQFLLSLVLLARSLYRLGEPLSVFQVAMYLVYVVIGVAFFYSLMIATACTSIWFGRNQGLYDFWFYITVFARYPRSIYGGTSETFEAGDVLQFSFTWIVPILLVITVPAQFVVGTMLDWRMAAAAGLATVAALLASRALFQWSLNQYRSASS